MNDPSPFSALVIEDSNLAREGLVDLLKAFPSVEVVGEAEHAERAAVLIKELCPRVLFLDIHMPGQTGLDLLSQLDYEPLIIFTTAYSEYAVRSFEFQTVDYLLKPISVERLAQAIEKLEKQFGNQVDVSDSSRQPEKMQADHHLFVKDKDECHIVSLTEIKYFESCKNYVRLFFGNHSAFIKKNLSQVEARLPDEIFFRCSRQYIINLQEITEIEESVNGGLLVALSDQNKIEVSRRNAVKLKSRLSI